MKRVPRVRDTQELVERFGLPAEAAARFDALLDGLAAEPDPPTTLRDRQDALEGHLADSLEGLGIADVRRAQRIADMGAGAGFPGLVLAVCLPHTEVDLIESARRKCAVIERLAEASGAANARVLAVRAEEWAAGDGANRYDVVTARAVASLPVLVEYAAPLLVLGGALVAWKGAREADEERRGAEAAQLAGMELEEVRPVDPFPAARDRHLHVYRKVKPTPDSLPRRPGRAGKRPLA